MVELSELAAARPLTASYLQWILIHSSQLISLADQPRIIAAINSSLEQPLICPGPTKVIRDKREGQVHIPIDLVNLKVFTDYAGLREAEAYIKFTLVDKVENSDFLFSTVNVTDFYAFDSKLRIAQFPFEGGFVCKVMKIEIYFKKAFCAT